MVKLGDPKNVFWEALLLTIIVFVFGLFLGYAIENSRIDKINEYYANSEISLIDALALNNVAELGNISCNDLVSANLDFADRIYTESKVLDNYDKANKLSDNIKLIHKRYDLLRTLLWTSASKTQQRCEGEFSVVVYVYERETDDLAKRATQNVWSKILEDLKEKRGSEIVLIPISNDKELSSLQNMIERYRVKSYPVVIVNNEVVYELKTVEELEQYLK
jgi:hypothetical protein